MANSGTTVIGEVTQLNMILADAAPQNATASVLPIGSMYASSAEFVGRQTQLDELATFLGTRGNPPSVAVVSGLPGVGKTAFVRQAALTAETAQPFTRALFTDQHGYDESAADRIRPDSLYGPLLRGLGIPGDQIPLTLGDRAALYHQVLDQHAAAGNSVLIWLDNVGDSGQIDGLIPGSPIHRVVVTTRETLPRNLNHLVIELDVLPIDDAVEVLAHAIDVGDNPRIAADKPTGMRLAELCDRLPLALQIIAALITDEPSRPLTDFVIELEEEEHRLDNLHYDDRTSVRAALALSYRRLPDQLQRLFRLISQVPGGEISLYAARCLITATPAQVRPQLMALVRSHLVQQQVTNQWRMHDLVRIFAGEMAATDADDAARALRSLVQNYFIAVAMAFEWLTAVASDKTRKVFATPAEAASWFEAERATAMSIITHIANREGYEQICLPFGVVLGDLLRNQAHWRTDFHHIAATTASVVSRVAPNRFAASALSNYGTSLRLQQQYQQAHDVFEQSVQMYEAIGDHDRASGARCNIANLLQERGQIDAAVAIYRQDLQQCPPSTHPHTAAGTLQNLGAVLTRAGRPAEAVPELVAAQELHRQIDDRSGLAATLLNLGGAYVELATKHKTASYAGQAVPVLEEAYAISQSLHDRKSQADAANNLGVVLCTLRIFDRGIAFLNEALEYLESSGQDVQAARTRWHRDEARHAAAAAQPHNI